jgi:hypothetical protein
MKETQHIESEAEGLTEEQALERLLEFVADPEWRMSSGFYLIESKPDNDPTAPGRIAPLKLRLEQERYLKGRHTRNFIPKARKLGMSTIIVLKNGDSCLFEENLFAAIIDKSEEDAFGKLGIFRFAWENGPNHPDEGMAMLWRWIHEANPLIVDNDGELAWSNGSRYKATTSATGNTPNRLHVSELGPISAQRPARSREIRRGSINAVLPHDFVDIETTMEGGRYGVAYDFFSLAKKSTGKSLSQVDWKLQFFPWWNHPLYQLPGRKATHQSSIQYFAELKEKHGIVLSDERMAWWEAKRQEQGEEMWQQFPSTIDEVDRAVVAGQIYSEMATLREKGRVCEFELEKGQPLYTFWDLGASDNVAGWLLQPCGKDWNIIDWSASEGAGAHSVAEVMRAWERMHGPIAGHYLPHDANTTDKGSGKTYVAQLLEAGIPKRLVRIVPRTPDVWVGVNEVRKRLMKLWFHSRTDVEIALPDGSKLPSGVGRLENYRKVITASTNVMKSIAVKDGVCDHTADALRTWAEADSLGMIRPVTNDSPASVSSTEPKKRLQAIMGMRG